MGLDLSRLEKMVKQCPEHLFTMAFEQGEWHYRSQEKGAGSQEGTVENVYFRSQLLRTMVEELKLSENSLFLKELCAYLKIGRLPGGEVVETALEAEEIARLLELVKQYRLEQTQLLEQVQSSELLKHDAALEGLIRNADLAMLRMIRRDCLLAVQAEAQRPCRTFLESVLVKPEEVTCASNLLAMVATVPGHARYTRKEVNEVLQHHRETLCNRAVALIQRDGLLAVRDYSKWVACTVEALDSLIKEVRLMRSPGTAQEQEQRRLLGVVAMRQKCFHPQEMPLLLAEIMRHQILMGDAFTLECYRKGFGVEGQISVPYPFGQGMQTVVGTETQRRCFESCLNATVQQYLAEGDPESVCRGQICVQRKDLQRRFIVEMGDERLTEQSSEAELLAKLYAFLDINTHPEQKPLAAACAILMQQVGVIATRVHPLANLRSMTMFDFKEGEKESPMNRRAVHAVREENGFRFEVEELMYAPQYANNFADGMNAVQMDARNSQDFIRMKAVFHVMMEDGNVAIRMTEAPEFSYHLSELDHHVNLNEVVQQVMARPDFMQKLHPYLKQVAKAMTDAGKGTQWSEVSLRYLTASITFHKDKLLQSVVNKLSREGLGIPSEEGIIQICARMFLQEVVN
ncbi:MAG: hypothetical protein IKM62_00630 [Kiritimatiellae bacterium]|nr:hypothetical protein [Kiritimatiellia bacterium]